MNILHISSMNAPSGLENRLSRFAQELSREHQQTLLVVSKSIHPALKVQVSKTCNVKHYKYAGALKLPPQLRNWYLKRWLKGQSFDAIVCYSQVANHEMLKLICEQQSQAKKIYYEGGILWYKSQKVKRTIDLFDHYIANSSGAEAILHERFEIPKANIKKIFNGIPLSYIDCEHNKEGKCIAKNSDQTTLIYVGRLIHQKGLITLILCMKYLPEHYMLWIIGNGSDEGFFTSKVEEFGLASQVKFWGFQNDVSKFYRSADLMILPSISESMSNSILEAGAHKLPVIAANIDGNTDLIEDGVTGFLMDTTLDLDNAELGLPKNKMPALVFNGATKRLAAPKALDPKLLAQKIQDLFEKAKTNTTMGEAMARRVETQFSMTQTTSQFIDYLKHIS